MFHSRIVFSPRAVRFSSRLLFFVSAVFLLAALNAPVTFAQGPEDAARSLARRIARRARCQSASRSSGATFRHCPSPNPSYARGVPERAWRASRDRRGTAQYRDAKRFPARDAHKFSAGSARAQRCWRTSPHGGSAANRVPASDDPRQRSAPGKAAFVAATGGNFGCRGVYGRPQARPRTSSS